MLKTGMFVRVEGLKSAPELNGRLGTITGYNTWSGRWEVDLEPYGMKALNASNLKPYDDPVGNDEQSIPKTAAEPSTQPRAASSEQPRATETVVNEPSQLRPGATVTLCGLTAAPELNGKLGRVLELDAVRGRWLVEVGGLATETTRRCARGVEISMTGVKALKADNLKVLNSSDSRIVGSKYEGSAHTPSPSVGRKRHRDDELPSTGAYTIAADVAIVTSDAAGEKQKVAKLVKGTHVDVVEVVRLPGDKRIRARIQNPAGWISLENMSSGFQWAVRADDIDPDEL